MHRGVDCLQFIDGLPLLAEQRFFGQLRRRGTLEIEDITDVCRHNEVFPGILLIGEMEK